MGGTAGSNLIRLFPNKPQVRGNIISIQPPEKPNSLAAATSANGVKFNIIAGIVNLKMGY